MEKEGKGGGGNKTQLRRYKSVSSELNARGNLSSVYHPIQEQRAGSENALSRVMPLNEDKRLPDWPLISNPETY